MIYDKWVPIENAVPRPQKEDIVLSKPEQKYTVKQLKLDGNKPYKHHFTDDLLVLFVTFGDRFKNQLQQC